MLAKVKSYLLQGWPSVVDSEDLQTYSKRRTELSLQDGCIFWGARVVVPPPGRSQIVEEIHEAHPGVSRMKSLARSYVWWPKIDLDLENKVKSCTQCQLNQHLSPPAPLHPWVWPDHPWSRLHLVFAGHDHVEDVPAPALRFAPHLEALAAGHHHTNLPLGGGGLPLPRLRGEEEGGGGDERSRRRWGEDNRGRKGGEEVRKREGRRGDRYKKRREGRKRVRER